MNFFTIFKCLYSKIYLFTLNPIPKCSFLHLLFSISNISPNKLSFDVTSIGRDERKLPLVYFINVYLLLFKNEL